MFWVFAHSCCSHTSTTLHLVYNKHTVVVGIDSIGKALQHTGLHHYNFTFLFFVSYSVKEILKKSYSNQPLLRQNIGHDYL